MISALLLVYKGGVMKILLPFFTPVNAFESIYYLHLPA